MMILGLYFSPNELLMRTVRVRIGVHRTLFIEHDSFSYFWGRSSHEVKHP